MLAGTDLAHDSDGHPGHRPEQGPLLDGPGWHVGPARLDLAGARGAGRPLPSDLTCAIIRRREEAACSSEEDAAPVVRESALSSGCAAVGPPTGRTLAGSGPKPGELAAAVTSAVENEIRPSND